MKKSSSRKNRRYSDAFKRKVVSDVNEGLYSAWRAMQINTGLIPGAGTTSEPTDYIYED